MPRTPATWFRVVAVAEALTWAGLLVGMLFKHVLQVTEVGVQVFGALHGAVFVVYLATALLVARPLAWSWRTTLVALAAAVPPFTTVVFERWAANTGRLGELSRVRAVVGSRSAPPEPASTAPRP